MKNMRHISSLIIVAGIVCTAIFLSSNKVNTPQESAQRTMQNVFPPEIPTQVLFAGDTIDLTLQDRRERMDKEMLSFTYSHINTMLIIKRANRLFPIVEPILKECGVPDDFKYLMLIESNGDPEALSPSKAGGLWQFLEKTGREYGLEVTEEIDERYHTEKATRAACKYLKGRTSCTATGSPLQQATTPAAPMSQSAVSDRRRRRPLTLCCPMRHRVTYSA